MGFSYVFLNGANGTKSRKEVLSFYKRDFAIKNWIFPDIPYTFNEFFNNQLSFVKLYEI